MNVVSIIFSILGSRQFQSVERSVLKIAGTWLIAKNGGDLSQVDTFVGSAMALIGALGSASAANTGAVAITAVHTSVVTGQPVPASALITAPTKTS